MKLTSLVDHATKCNILKVKENETKTILYIVDYTDHTEGCVKLHFSKYNLLNEYLIIISMIY